MGTILMVAVTVALGATVLAIMSGVGSDKPSESSKAVFQATGIDSEDPADGKTDAIKLTYIAGPILASGDVTTIVRNAGGTVASPAAQAWSPGEFVIADPATGGAWLVTISALGTTIVDQTITLDE